MVMCLRDTSTKIHDIFDQTIALSDTNVLLDSPTGREKTMSRGLLLPSLLYLKYLDFVSRLASRISFFLDDYDDVLARID